LGGGVSPSSPVAYNGQFQTLHECVCVTGNNNMLHSFMHHVVLYNSPCGAV